ncbi:hypothetical protein QE152_g41267, partial [Popillia japonica]
VRRGKRGPRTVRVARTVADILYCVCARGKARKRYELSFWGRSGVGGGRRGNVEHSGWAEGGQFAEADVGKSSIALQH